MDRNTIIGFLLIGIVLFAFSYLNRPTPEQQAARKHYEDSIALVQKTQAQLEQKKTSEAEAQKKAMAQLPDSMLRDSLKSSYGDFAQAAAGSDSVTVLENNRLEVHLSNKGGRVNYVRLKEFDNYQKKPVILFDDATSSFNMTLVTATNRVVNTEDLFFTPVKSNDPNTVIMRLDAGQGHSLDFIYTLKPNDYMMSFNVKSNGLNGILAPNSNSVDIEWTQAVRQQEKGRQFESRYVSLNYKFVADNVEKLSESKASDTKKLTSRVKWIGYKDMFFSTVLISKDGFESTNVESTMPQGGKIMKNFKTTTTVAFDLQGKKLTEMTFFFGPNKFEMLKAYDKGVNSEVDQLTLGKLVPLGWGIFRWVNQYFVIPLFDFLGKFISSYGILILVLTIIVKLILFPLTYKSYMSTAKMRVLRPQVEEINKKYPGQDKAMDRQKATMELYSRAGASPMSGCLPMLLQMPILIALFMFFPSAFELRHQSFLWASDLSTYDAVVSWSANIPFITSYFGNHISLFCVLMTITNIIYTKWNMDMTSTGQPQMPGMKAVMYLMPLMFLVFFNQYASGLTYYYFISMLISILQTLYFRLTIDEDKLLAKLEENKKKPMKKSGFMKRLEEAQRQQQQAQQRPGNKKR